MMIISLIAFVVSLIAITGLFVVKQWETGRGKVLVPEVRVRADTSALKLKARLMHLHMDAAKLPPIAVLFSRYLVHESALGFAAFARAAERQSHRVADLVSHKRYFVARETRSDFLKKVSEHKLENGADHS